MAGLLSDKKFERQEHCYTTRLLGSGPGFSRGWNEHITPHTTFEFSLHYPFLLRGLLPETYSYAVPCVQSENEDDELPG